MPETLAAPPLAVGEAMHQLIAELFPICRSITGDGVRQTLARLQREVPLSVHEVPTGTRVLDWTVPDEWNVRDAWIKDRHGTRVVDFQASTLHLVSYSIPVRGAFTLSQLQPHLHSLPDRPDLIPYRTAYHEPSWGFCLSERQRAALADGVYEVCVDTTLIPGSLTYGELLVPGALADEVLLSAHICHPSLANDNLSGVALALMLARWVMERPRRYSYRFLFAPGTIGAITWLATHEHSVERIRHGLVLAGVGDRGPATYKQSRQGRALVDRAAAQVLPRAAGRGRVRPFTPVGYDERQFCSPGYNLPVGCFTRTPFGEYPEYHTSGDNLDFVSPEALADSYRKVREILEIVEQDRPWLNTLPKGEPQLGRRGLYDLPLTRGSATDSRTALLWVLNLSDGSCSLLDIAERSSLPFPIIAEAAEALASSGLLRAAEPRP